MRDFVALVAPALAPVFRVAGFRAGPLVEAPFAADLGVVDFLAAGFFATFFATFFAAGFLAAFLAVLFAADFFTAAGCLLIFAFFAAGACLRWDFFTVGFLPVALLIDDFALDRLATALRVRLAPRDFPPVLGAPTLELAFPGCLPTAVLARELDFVIWIHRCDSAAGCYSLEDLAPATVDIHETA